MLSLARDRAIPLELPSEPGLAPVRAALSVNDDVGALADEWRRFEVNALGHVFQTYDFIALWVATVGRDRGVRPRIVVGRAPEGGLLFLLPFGIRRCLGARMFEWLGGELADYHGGLFAPQYLLSLSACPKERARFVRSVVDLVRGEVDVIHWQRQPERIATLPNPFASFNATPFSAQSHLTRLGDDWEAYYRSKRNSSSRRHDRQKWERMLALGDVRVIDAATPEEVRRILDALYAMKAKSLAARGVPDFFAAQSVRDFYERLGSHLHPEGPAHVSAIEVKGAIVAANWGLVRGNHYYYVMTSYADGEVSRSSPGRALMYHLMQWSIARGIDVFDFTIGDEDFKTQWCEESAQLYESVALLNGRGLPLATSLRAMKAAKRLVKRNPRLKNAVDGVRKRLMRAG